MTYFELALKLKTSGYPQKGDAFRFMTGLDSKKEKVTAYMPSGFELHRMCGGDTIIKHTKDGIEAIDNKSKISRKGASDIEALVNLWRAKNKKKA